MLQCLHQALTLVPAVCKRLNPCGLCKNPGILCLVAVVIAASSLCLPNRHFPRDESKPLIANDPLSCLDEEQRGERALLDA